ncbi:Tol biopolymer transport system component [Micromonospora sp. A200]|uniref:hypothetical protein n=1 Tax=Micromonospora sp. A200 TaxID=2940568 RepID=UPI0024746FB7|nr:hypothetical protein [Micromonospora sp. A200]MDH6465619.1 Tol biopolymer transport system component [Micromonospora sp. A200]
MAATTAAAVMLPGLAASAPPAAPPRPAPATPPVAEERIAYAGTKHRSIGVVRGEGGAAVSLPFFPIGPDHFDDEVSARGDTITWVSRRDATTTEVYLRRGDGPVLRLTVNTSSEAHPTISPDGTRVAFDSGAGRGGAGHDIFVIGVDGTGLRRVTDGVGDNRWPSWSPDGTSLAFEGRRGGEVPQVYRIPVAGGAVTQVTSEPTGAGQPAWDPNPAHDRIAYTCDPDSSTNQKIHLVSPSGAGDRLLLPVEWQSREAAWSPDGSTLAFVSRTPPDGGPLGQVDLVYTGVPRDDGCSCTAQLRLAEDRQLSFPAFYTAPGESSPSLIVIRNSAPDRRTATLQDIRPDGVDPRDLRLSILREDPKAERDSRFMWQPTEGDPWTERQTYSPDGRRIAVSRFETVDGRRVQRIWTVDADGTSPRLLPVAGRGPDDLERDPEWSPDGSRIALVRNRPSRPARVIVVDASTGQQLLAVPTPPPYAGLDDTQPAWSPDGALLAFTRGRYNEEASRAHVWTANATDGLDQRDLTRAVCGRDCDVVDDSAAFAPDGRQIAFNRREDGLVLTDVDGTRCRLLFPPSGASCAAPVPPQPDGPFQPRDVSWSPDGQRLVFSARRERDQNSPEALHVYDMTTGRLASITGALPGRQKEPTWQRSVDVATAVVTTPPTTTVGGRTAFTLSVTDRGPSPAPAVRLDLTVPSGVQLTALVPERGTCRLTPAGCDLEAIGVGRTLTVRVELTGIAAGSFPLSWSVNPGVTDAVPADNRARTDVRIVQPPPTAPADPALTVSVTPAPAYVGGSAGVTYTVRNAGGQRATGLRLNPTLPPRVRVAASPPGCAPQAGCRLPDLAPGGATTVTFVLTPDAALAATVAGAVTTTGGNADPANDTASAPLRVLQPRIVAVPAIGPPGFVTSVRGTDFPPGARVRLAWNVGITAATAPAVAAPDGTFAAQLLVLPKDRLGPREITASGTGFAPVTTPFRVVLPPLQPPGHVNRRW